MKIIHHPEDLVTAEPVVLAMGFFDGVHRGHQAVMQAALQEANRQNGQAWVLTFEPHPLKLICPEKAPALLTSTPHKTSILKLLGMHGCILMDFTPELKNTSARDFIQALCNAIPSLSGLVVGQDWRFGAAHQGDVSQLAQLAAPFDVVVQTIDPILDQENPVSSTRIRQAIREGRLREAGKLLGRPFSLWGNVIHGRRVGHTLGYPTANIDPHNEVHPPAGIYASFVLHQNRLYKGAAYIGGRPTFANHNGEWVLEVNILDQTEELDLYDQDLEVFFVDRIRDDRKFDDTATLQDQIEKDIIAVRNVLETHSAAVANWLKLP
jgi:riboflavin kinase/FMN adenylyltransferase